MGLAGSHDVHVSPTVYPQFHVPLQRLPNHHRISAGQKDLSEESALSAEYLMSKAFCFVLQTD